MEAVAVHSEQERSGKPRFWRPLFRLMRPQQWVKNFFCFAGVLFGPGRLPQPHAWFLATMTFLVFVAGSSSIYVLNDILDRERDRKHPKKRKRPIASGAIGVGTAAVLGSVLAIIAVAGAAVLGHAVLVCVVLYLVNNLAYSWRLKNLALLDVLSIALGFVLRLLAGVYALGDLPTAWIVLCTFFLALFLGLAKRRAELASLIEEDDKHRRPVLFEYSLAYLDSLLHGTSMMAVMCYALFTTTAHKNPTLVVTVPIVFFALMHYKRLVVQLNHGEEPERVLVKSGSIWASVILWLASYLIIYWGHVHLFLDELK